ncbi:ADP-ribosylglycohydrolase [Desulfatibacillum alkenivorans DSM 16219]|jgi:ADP-ribosylglycohydrolase|uniref:ADP-ribosylglycohydrolase n=1 Tax=Desulfatibacillum alkenivorans DSM 16219 TaxID=1121393 RepID=A0A1M6NW13_9BACT|nr:ADP-ribosylglycohydrolase family protein [Desulfatibacillum alkenivorans]SHJ99838.1 ADP-ribosylglycohydrolase [Desulfatibacillum alkenivorans DSM 16219]
MSNIDAKFKAILYGLAIGDALGFQVEFSKLPHIYERFGREGVTDLPEDALFSDDTQMTIAIAEALVKAGDKDLESIMAEVRREFIKWLHSPENNRAPGNACLIGVENMETGIHWSQSGVADSKGCGSAMRVAPVGYLYQNQPEKLKEVASATGICTHGHPTGDAACIGAAYLVKLALDGIDPGDMVPRLLEFTKGISQEFDEAILKITHCLDWDDEDEALSCLGEGWIGEEAVALALYCFLRYPNDYKKTVLRAANTNGDSDSIACVAGGISGAYLGLEAIPRDWISRIEKSEYLEDLADRLAKVKNNKSG